MEQREAFIAALRSGEFAMTTLCERFGVSRPTGYKWMRRAEAEGRAGLHDRERTPHTHPNATPAYQVEAILALKRRHLHWGPCTLHAWLCREHSEQSWPAVSTVGEILKRHGLVQSRRHRPHAPPHTQPFAHIDAANDVWSADFKGQFRLGDGRLCYPLTLTDNHSRFLLCCQGLYHPRGDLTRRHFERTFREYGLPKAMRTDNGAPFASIAVGGLSALSIWMIKLGIKPERITPGRPQQNGRHERMHRTLKAATAAPPKANLSAQQRAFNRFQHEFNQERPHRGLGGGQRPSEVHRPSPRPYPDRLPEVVYPVDCIPRKVRQEGHIRWQGHEVFVSKTLVGEPVGLKPLDHDRWELYFGPLILGIVDARLGKVLRPRSRLV